MDKQDYPVEIFDTPDSEDRVTVLVVKDGKTYVISFDAFPWTFADVSAQVACAGNSIKQAVQDV
jgi:hypothetical protein